MPKRRAILGAALASAGSVVLGVAAGCNRIKGQDMQEIKFDLGKNIVETAKASGVPAFSNSNVNGNTSYSVNNIPPQIVTRYTRAGYEIAWQFLFAFTMTADEKLNNDLTVYRATLQLGNDAFKAAPTPEATHIAAQAFIDQTTAQFKKGKWQRYFREDARDDYIDARLTGRSSYLDEKGELDVDISPLDPYYQISSKEWPAIADLNLRYEWIGDNVLARLRVGYSFYPNRTNPVYAIDLEFEQFDLYLQRWKKRLAEDLKKGDDRGWGSTAKAATEKVEWAARRKLLESNAVKRGDPLVPMP